MNRDLIQPRPMMPHELERLYREHQERLQAIEPWIRLKARVLGFYPRKWIIDRDGNTIVDDYDLPASVRGTIAKIDEVIAMILHPGGRYEDAGRAICAVDADTRTQSGPVL